MFDLRDLLELPAALNRRGRPRVALNERLPDGQDAANVALGPRPRVVIDATPAPDPLLLAPPRVYEGETRPRVVGSAAPAEPPPQVAQLTAAAQGQDAPVSAGDALLLAPPPTPVPMIPPATRPASEFQSTYAPMNRPKVLLPAGEEAENDALVRSRLDAAGQFVEGGDVHTRPRIADPLEFAANRVRDDVLAPPAQSHHSRLYEMGAGAWRGFQRGGLGGAIVGAGMGGVAPDSIARMRQQEQLGRDQNDYLTLYQQQKAQTGLEGEQISNQARAATIPYLLARPEIERSKLEDKRAYDAWRMKSGDRKQDSAENYVRWRMENGDRRATTAEGLAELKREWQNFYEPYLTNSQEERKRHDLVGESQGQQRIGLVREGLGLRRYLGEGNLDARWASVSQGYDRLGADRQKQVDALAEKAAKAEAEASYFGGQSGKEAEAKLKREEAEGYRKRAEDIANRPAPVVSRPPVSSGRFAGQRMPRSRLPEAAKRLGMSEADAEALITKEGGVIY